MPSSLSGQPQTPESAVQAGLLSYIPFPDALVGKYQTHTQADLSALRAAEFEEALAGDAVQPGTGSANYIDSDFRRYMLMIKWPVGFSDTNTMPTHTPRE